MLFPKKKILICLAATLLMCVCLYLLSGFFAGLYFTSEKIEQLVLRQTGLNAQLKNTRIKTLPDLSLMIASESVLLNLPEGENILRGSNIKFRVKLIPLLFKKLSISLFYADNLSINIERDNDGLFNFQKFIKAKSNIPLKIKFKNANLNFNDFSFSFADNKNKKNLFFESKKFAFVLNNHSKYLKHNSEGILKVCDINTALCTQSDFNAFVSTRFPLNRFLDSKDTDFDIQVKNADFSAFLPYINEFSGLKFAKSDLKFDFLFKKVEQKPFNVYSLDFNSSDIFLDFDFNNKKNKVILPKKSELKLNFVAKKNALEVNNSYFVGKDFNIKFLGYLLDYKTNKPKADFNIKIADSDIMRFVYMLPAGIVDYKTDLINELINAKPYAKVNGDIYVKGDCLKPDIKGKMSVKDIFLFSRPKGFDTANVECEFVGDKVNVDVYVPGPNSQFVRVKGYSEIYNNQAGSYEVVSSDDVDLAFAHKYLIPVQRVIGFKLGPLPYMKISGVGKIHINTSGTIYDAIVNGKFYGKNIKASLEGLNSVLTNGKIELDFNGKVINIQNTSAEMSGGKFFLKGFADDFNNLDVTASIKNIQASNLLNIAKTSCLIKPYSGDLSFIKSASGPADMDIIFKGKAKSLEGIDFMNDIKPHGTIYLNGVNAVIQPKYPFYNAKGKIIFSDKFDIDIISDFMGAKSFAKGFITPDSNNLADKNTKLKLDLNIGIKSMLFSRFSEMLSMQDYLNNRILKFVFTNSPIKEIDFLFGIDGHLKGAIPSDFKNFDFSKLSINGNFTPYNSPKSKNIEFISGKYSASGTSALISNSHIKFFGSDIFSDGQILDFTGKPRANLKLRANSFALDKMQNIADFTDIQLFKVLLSDFTDYKGLIGIDLNLKKNLPYGKVSFNNVSMFNKKQQIPLLLKSGGIKFAGEKIFLDALNFNYGNTPIYFNASITNYLSERPLFNAMYSTNIDEISADKLINPYLTYPFKVKGETRMKGRIKGDFDNYSIISYLTLPQGTDITYMGANFGDTQYDREFEVKADFTKNIAKINSAKYVKFIPSQNNKPTAVTMLRAGGKIVSSGKNLFFNNFNIVTPNPVTAKVFNVIFKKSVLKQGLFTCDLNLNGNVLLPHATGKINFSNINIPLYSTQINDLDCNISKNTINAFIRGKSFDSDVEIISNIRNRQQLPVIVDNLEINSKKISLSRFIEGISHLPKGSSDIVPGQPIVLRPQDLIITKGHAKVDSLELYNIKASNFYMDFSNPTGDMLNINNMEFNIASGTVKSKGNFDISSLLFDIDSIVYDCDANVLSESFLGLQNQIYGKTNAKINLKGKIPENAQDIKLVSGNVNFSVNNGKMPKLGSLEYLLRAGNLIKSGILGLTLNNLIEVLTPYKTGEFSAIKGSFDVHDGKISSLEIFSKGNNLSLFIYGGYDVINDNADIEILGRLSKNVSNVLGAFGNASLNTLLSTITGNKIKEGAKSQIIENVNKIPLIEISGDDYRLFLAKIKGKLNSDGYVKSFNWLN